MKRFRTRTLRGQIEVTGGVGRKNIIVSDGLINWGIKVKKFSVWAVDPCRHFHRYPKL